MSAAGGALTLGQPLFIRIQMPSGRPILVTNVNVCLTTLGATLTAGQNFVGLYNKAGNLLAISADQSGVWTGSTGMKTTPMISPTLVYDDVCYAALLANGTTPPQFARVGNPTAGSPGINRNAVTPNLPSVNSSVGSLTTLPAQAAFGTGGSLIYADLS